MPSSCQTDVPIEQPIPVPQLVLLDLPDELLADVAHPVAQGNTEGDTAILIESYRSTLAGVNDERFAARRIQNCQRDLIAGRVETC
jgi:hypothetical protein